MKSHPQGFFAPPALEDEENARQAYYLNIIVWTLVFIPIIYLAYILAEKPSQIPRTLVQVGVGEVVNLLIIRLLHRGNIRAATLIQIGALWLFFTLSAITGEGARGESYLLGYPLVIMVTGILKHKRVAIGVTALSLATGWGMAYAEMKGLFIPSQAGSPLTTWVISLIIIPLGTVLQMVATRAMQNALQRARESEDRYKLISMVSFDYTFGSVIDKTGKVEQVWVAGAFEKMTGYTFEEYAASGGWSAHLHPDDAEKDAQDLERLRQNQNVVNSELRTFTKSGEVRWERIFAHPIWDEKENSLTRIVGAVQDITERKKIELEREALIKELEAKNAELERYTYTVSHDLKSPLVTIRGFLGYLEKDALAGNAQKVRDDVRRIEDAAKKMQALLNDLLELSRIGRLMNQPSEARFTDIVKDAVELVRGQIEAKNLTIEIQDSPLVVFGDRMRLTEVIQNLVDNAAKFMGSQPKPRVTIGAITDTAGEAVFFVRDNGIGIDKQFHERVFTLFNKLNPETEGTGIGLALVKRIVEVHKGRIWIESEPGKGATFYFTLQEKP